MAGIVIAYTAVFGGYDTLAPSKYPVFCVTDNAQRVVGWENLEILRALNAKDSNRWCKMHPHELFPYADATIYFDGNIRLLESPDLLVDKYLSERDIAVFEHPEGRTSIYEEGEAVVEKRKAKQEDVDITLRYLKDKKYPENAGLAACFVLIRRNCNVINKMNEVWWELYQKLPAKRDQLTFNYVCWKLGIEYATIAGNLFKGTSEEFKRGKHQRTMA